MKHSTVRRWLAFLLSAVLLASLLPALSLTAGARAPQKVNASSADELKTYLESSTDYDITLTKAIDKYIGETDVWCKVVGNKRLDMNGFDILVHQDEGKGVSSLFQVTKSGNLTVYDSKNAGAKAKIHYHAKIRNEALTGTYPYWRHLFQVFGRLTLNNVQCTAGRKKEEYNSWFAANMVQQTYGSAVAVHADGYLEVNGAYLSGHAYPQDPRDTPVIQADSDSEISFNFGEVHGHSQADCFRVSRGAAVHVASGYFECDYYSKVWYGTLTEGYRINEPGRVGLEREYIADDAVVDNSETAYATRLTVTAPRLPCYIAVYDGSSDEGNGVTNLRVPGENPILRAWISEPYFHTAVEDSPQAEHIYRVIWEIYDGLTFMAEKVKFGDFDLNLMKDFQDFTPEQGKRYRIRCTIAEHLRQGITGAACWRYASRTSDYYVQVVEDMLAPVITRDLPSSAVFTPGQRLQLSIRASGDNLSYQWYALDPSRPTRPEAISGQNTGTLTISNARETLDGAYIYCVVSNAAGSVRTTHCKLAKEQTVIKEIPILNLDQPRHGVPLDTDMDIDVPGLRLVDSTWMKIKPDPIEFVPLSDSDINDPIAGQSLALRLVVAHDNTVVLDNFASASALGHSVVFSEYSGNLYTFYFTSITVMADETMDIDLAFLSFYGKSLAVGEKVPNLAERDCGFADLGLMALLDPDIRYKIHSKKWFVDGVETEEPTVEEDHTYTLKVRLQPDAGWKFAEDTAIFVDGETLPVTLDTVSVGKERITYALFELEYATRDTAVPANPFVDVLEGAYYYDAVLWAVNHDPQITNGTDATHFSPNRTCTRAQVVTFLWRAMGEPEPTKTDNPFTDVKEGQYYYKAVLWAVENNITNGVSPTAFGPDRGCTRAQVVTFLWRAEGQPEPTKADNPFTDVKADQYYYKAVLWAVEKDITKGTSADKFSPDATCTRGQIVTFLYRDMK